MVLRDPFLLVSSSTRSDRDRTDGRAGSRATALGSLGPRRGEVGEVKEIGGPTKECSNDQVCRNAKMRGKN